MVQRTHNSLQYNSTALILGHSAFFIFQLSHPYMTTGKTVALTRQTFVYKVMSLLFNMLSRLVITFLPEGQMKTFIKASCDLPFDQLTISLLSVTDSSPLAVVNLQPQS